MAARLSLPEKYGSPPSRPVTLTAIHGIFPTEMPPSWCAGIVAPLLAG